MDKGKFFEKSEPIGTKRDDVGGRFVLRSEIYSLIKKYAEDNRFASFEIDFLKVSKVWDTVDDAADDMSKFGMVSGKFIYSESQKLQKTAKAYPLNVSSFELPLPKEIIPVIKYNETNYYLDQLTLNGLIPSYSPEIGMTDLPSNTLKTIQERVEGYDAPKNPKKRPIVNQGSKQISSRYGSSILMDHKESKPSIRLSNNQSQSPQNASFFSPTFFREGSTILLDSDTTENFPMASVQNVQRMNDNNGNKIIINSDQLIFQSRQDSIHINSPDTIYINAPNVKINNEPAVMGYEVSDVLHQILDMLGKIISGILSHPTTAGGFTSGAQQAAAETYLMDIREQLDEFLATDGKHGISKLKDGISESKAGDI
ncbi:hypothetical protein HN615_00985 [Candidatus Woesearchaeota archaeon]|jgi:hypothetical protein|nr:hypothetical protein [Candidatus Woesearchaeota archaeon]